MGYRRYTDAYSASITALTSSLYTTVTSGSSVISLENTVQCMRVNQTGTTNNFYLLPPGTPTTNSYIVGVVFESALDVTASFDIKYAAGTASILNAPMTGVLSANTTYTASLNSNTAYRFVKNGTRMLLTSSATTGSMTINIFYKNQIP